MIRTHNCGELRINDVNSNVELIGWAQRLRDHGGKKFIDLRDRYGITQIVFDPQTTKDFSLVDSMRREFLIHIKGRVEQRPEGSTNEKHTTGEVEVLVDDFSVINESDVLPFDLDEDHFKDVSEDLRLEYRYLDLRRPQMQQTFMRRHKFITAVRNCLNNKDFIEMDTPILTKSTPEGARDLLVPSRKHKGSFYALPQSPQLFKQLLMVAGFEKYYQIVKCFRDEDSRKDRQLEFTQIDMEVSFLEFDEFKRLAQDVLIDGLKVYNQTIDHNDFTAMTYLEALNKYGSDKPDLRIKGMELVNFTDIANDCEFSVFKNVAKQGGLIKGFNLNNGQSLMSRNEIDRLIDYSKELGSKGLAWMKVLQDNTIESSISKFFTTKELETIKERLSAQSGDLLFFIADTPKHTNDILDGLRRFLADKYGLIDKDKLCFTWICDFPLFQFNEEENRLDAEHSPFTMPNKEAVEFIMKNINTDNDVIKFKEELLSLKGDCYDIALNGIEICSGAQRINIPKLQEKIFTILKLKQEDIDLQFGWFIKAYNYGAPFHRGLAFGLDRIIMLLEDKKSIREVIAFPKNKVGYCPLTHSPSPVDEKQLREIHVKLRE